MTSTTFLCRLCSGLEYTHMLWKISNTMKATSLPLVKAFKLPLVILRCMAGLFHLLLEVVYIMMKPTTWVFCNPPQFLNLHLKLISALGLEWNQLLKNCDLTVVVEMLLCVCVCEDFSLYLCTIYIFYSHILSFDKIKWKWNVNNKSGHSFRGVLPLDPKLQCTKNIFMFLTQRSCMSRSANKLWWILAPGSAVLPMSGYR